METYHNNGIQPLGNFPPEGHRPQASSMPQAIVRSGRGASHLAPASGMPSATDLLKALRRRWLLATTLAILCAGAAVAIVWSVVPPAEYRAQTRLRVSSKPPRLIFQTSENQIDFPTYQRTQLALIKSQFVLNEAINVLKNKDKLGVIPSDVINQVLWLEEKIQASFDGEILRISMAGPNSKGLKDIVNAVRVAYLSEVVDAERVARKSRLDNLNIIYSDYQNKLGLQRVTLRKLAENLGSSDQTVVKTSHELALERLFVVERELMDVESQLRKATVELKVLQRTRSVGSPTAFGQVASASLIDSLIRDDKGVKDLQIERERLDRAYRDAVRRYRNPNSQDPVLLGLRENLASNQEALEARISQLRAYYAEHPPQSGPIATNPVAALQQKIAMLQEEESLVAREKEKLQQETKEINVGAIDLETIKAEIAKMDRAADEVGAEIEALNVELTAPLRVQELEEAGDPQEEPDKRLKMAGMGGLGTFALVLLGVSWLELQTRRVNSVHEVAHGLGLPIIGALPPHGRKRHQSAPKKATPDPPQDHMLVESIDAVRTHLLHSMRLNGVRSVMITSAVTGEGKSSLACHLSISIARARRRTLLIDGDLRKPVLHRLFDQPPVPGFSELLRGQVTLDEVIRPTGVQNLWMIPAGQWDRQAVEAMTLDSTRTIFDHLKDEFDHVVIDSSPVLPVTDALLLGQHVDAAIYSVRRDFSRVPLVQGANERLTKLGIRVLGAVVTNVRSATYAGEYRYGDYKCQEATDA